MREIDRRKFIALCADAAGFVATNSVFFKLLERAAPPAAPKTALGLDQLDRVHLSPLAPTAATPSPTAGSSDEISLPPDAREDAALIRRHASSRGPRPTETPLAAPKYDPSKFRPTSNIKEGQATYYSKNGCVGCSPNQIMANGEPFDENGFTLAYWETNLNEWVLVENPNNGLSALAKVTDRGHFHHYGFIADLSKGLRNALGGKDLTQVRITHLEAIK